MSVRKTKGGKWVADVVVGVRLDGRPDRRTRTCATKREAGEAERALLNERDARRGRVSGRVTLAEFVDRAFWPQKAGLRPNSRATYERDLMRRVLPVLGGTPVREIDRWSVQRVIDACPTESTAKKARGVLSAVLSLAVEMGVADVNVASFRTYRYPPRGRRPSRDGAWLTTFDEHRALLGAVAAEAPGSAVERIVVLGLCMGLRKEEVLGADWEDVDDAAGELEVRRSYTVAKGGAYVAEPKTERSARRVPVTMWARARMAEWAERGRSGPIVIGPGGGRMSPSTAVKAMRRWCDAHPGLPRVTCGSLRHSFATACIVDARVPVAVVSKWLGHAKVSTTYDRYVRPRTSDLHASAAELDRLLEPPPRREAV